LHLNFQSRDIPEKVQKDFHKNGLQRSFNLMKETKIITNKYDNIIKNIKYSLSQRFQKITYILS